MSDPSTVISTRFVRESGYQDQMYEFEGTWNRVYDLFHLKTYLEILCEDHYWSAMDFRLQNDQLVRVRRRAPVA